MGPQRSCNRVLSLAILLHNVIRAVSKPKFKFNAQKARATQKPSPPRLYQSQPKACYPFSDYL
jgi:hypothetical protein